jgi:hypothetical protein
MATRFAGFDAGFGVVGVVGVDVDVDDDGDGTATAAEAGERGGEGKMRTGGISVAAGDVGVGRSADPPCRDFSKASAAA